MIITLTDGTQVDTANVTFNQSNYHFTYGDEDVTNLIREADKVANWSNFDPRTDALRAYNEIAVPSQGGTAVPLSYADNPPDSSTLDNFVTQITTDPLSAPLAASDKLVKNSFSSFFTSVTGWLVTGVVAVILYFQFIFPRRNGK